MFSSKWFFDIEKKLQDMGLDSDHKPFDEIKKSIANPRPVSDTEFASMCIYVILAGGFSQKTAKRIHQIIMDELQSKECCYNDLFSIFHNKNKVNAILKIWENSKKYRDEYYNLKTLDDKLMYLAKLPHIGKITANHLARNLGEDIVKYDIWIQRLGVFFSGRDLKEKIDNKKLNPEIKNVCDEMFLYLVKETGLPRGYIDVVLWKALQNGFIKV